MLNPIFSIFEVDFKDFIGKAVKLQLRKAIKPVDEIINIKNTLRHQLDFRIALKHLREVLFFKDIVNC
jgi:hypothetical protein